MATGTVNFFHDGRGYGFIDSDAADEDVFFHMDDVEGPDLQEGEEVEFEIEQRDKGPRAVNVTRTGDADTSSSDDDDGGGIDSEFDF
jgi:CspA family cold shock protein